MRAELAALELRRLSRRRVRKGLGAVAGQFAKYDLLTYSSAIAFQVLYAVVPLALLALAALGLFGLGSVFHDHVVPVLRRDLSPDAFRIAERTGERVIGAERVRWATAGLLVTLWGVAASLRAMMRPLNGVYGADETRSWTRRLLVSLGTATVVVVCVYAALGVSLGGRLLHAPAAVEVAVAVARWLVTLALLLAAIAAILRFVPAKARPVQWVSLGSLLAAVAWLVATAGFGAWISVVSYSSFYGALASVVLLLVYLHVSAIAFLLGVVVDALLREAATASARGGGRGRRRRARRPAGR